MGFFDNDADIEMAQLEEAGNRAARLRKRGICDHGWLQGHPDGTVTCNHCGKVFASFDAAYAAHDEVMS